MGKDVHVVMLPWLAFGHLMPYFQLSIALAKAGLKISFISTPRNIQRLPKIPPNLTHLFNYVAIPLPKLDNDVLPEGAEATVDLPADKISYLNIAFDLLQQPVKQFLAESKPDWVLIDLLCHWMPEIARELHVPLMYFSVSSAPALLFVGVPDGLVGESRKKFRPSWESLASKPQWVDFPSSVAFTKHEAFGHFMALYSENSSGTSGAERFAKVVDGCDAVSIRSCREYEGDYLDTLQKVLKKPVIPVGLLPPEKPKATDFKIEDSWVETFQWLDQQKPKSVVFVGFGSECKLSKDEIYEIAHGLELSGLPFVWALRKPSWANDEMEALPPGFKERTSGKGIAAIGWAPQMEILAHASIGGSLFHSGWGSAIETLMFGNCLVLLPLIIEQPLNARFFVEKGLGVEVERAEDGSFSRDGIARALRLAMVDEDGKALRERAREAAEVFGNQKLHQEHYIGQFVEFLKGEGKN